MDLRNWLWIFLFLILSPLPACYHMRIEAEPIAPRVIKISGDPEEALIKIRKLVRNKWKYQIDETDTSGNHILTIPFHLSTDTGFGQPAGGRDYFTQLRIEFQNQNGTALARLSHLNYEIRTSYVYSSDGKVMTLEKHYPYEEYPGMFDLTSINKELDRASTDILRIF